MTPRTRYAKSGGVSIAYQVVGEGPKDLVFVPGFVSNVETWWEQPQLARCMERLASFSRLILLDKRGTGLSDPVAEVKLAGMAVHIAARVVAEAAPDEVLVSGTLKDILVGSSFSFEDRGARHLKGVPGEWRLYAVEG
jgi:pimeloyl-ACP methyl ester carboxylesterase